MGNATATSQMLYSDGFLMICDRIFLSWINRFLVVVGRGCGGERNGHIPFSLLINCCRKNSCGYSRRTGSKEEGENKCDKLRYTEQALKRKVRRSATNSTALAQDIYES